MNNTMSIIALIPALLFAQNTDWYNDPNAPVYEISTEDELKGLAQLANSRLHFENKIIKLAKDIALTDTWIPIGIDLGHYFWFVGK